MDDDLRERVEREAEKHALLNAVKYESDADVGAVMGPLMGENPEFREYGDEIPGVIAPVVERVNGMDAEERRERLAELAPEKLEELEAEDEGEDHPLPDLPNVEEYDRCECARHPTRTARGTSATRGCPLLSGRTSSVTTGSSSSASTTPTPRRSGRTGCLRRNSGAIDYLGFEPDDVVNASDRVETYYEYARKLIDKGGAYTCSCPRVSFRT